VNKKPRITIAFTRYAEPDWLVRETIDSLSRQQRVHADILFLDQQDDPEMRAYHEGQSTEQLNFEYFVIPAIGSSYARNQAIKLSNHEIILFTDSDAIPEPTWAFHMQKSLERDNVGLVGSKVVPIWHKKPLFLARSPMLRRKYGMLELGESEIPCEKLWSVSLGMHRVRLGDNAYFDEGLGRSDGNLLGGEDTELCWRVVQMGLSTVYNGAAVLRHQVLPERISYKWLMKRIYYGGFDRAISPRETLRPSPQGRVFMDYVAYFATLPAMTLGYLKGRQVLAAKRRR
jgi:cellulose synthase/poly-beta-1,6-N-acetylglucosamine synthase-like glycosyltransferase